MAVAAVRGEWVRAAAGVRGGRIRFGLVNGFVAQRLLFARGLERKPVSMRWFRRRLAAALAAPPAAAAGAAEGHLLLLLRPLVEGLAQLIGDRPCLEIAAGDGTLSRFLRAPA